jgi:uncharacterized OsmC-like protein
MTTEAKEPEGPVVEPALDRSVMVRTGRDRFRTDVMVRGHPVVVDEPEILGGKDLGPTPYDLLCTALGSCTTITLRMYADRKGWPLEEVTARVTHHRVRATEGSADASPIDHFRVELDFRGPLTLPQRVRLLEIADRCPVHRTLVGGSRIQTVAMPSERGNRPGESPLPG